ncbi:uncharacterized protein LOC121982481 isoform X1 [Zingiber officinale]|uniref:Homer protein n=2 Tax=Zingiber officinale TaxID=94328 RepID=A0A8J5LDQ4_ZINOF|nr:uncharacterized protein LOC121982481 isoform X1 [Zingiber officinale]KAG6509212.1 hypothetical protein ZIOFF_034603 [Zingiber officinale]
MSSLPPPIAIAPPLHSVPSSLLGQRLLIYGDPLHFRLRKSRPSSNPVIFRSCFISRSRSLRCLCSADPKGTGSRPDEIVSGMVEKLLQREENKALLDGLEKASARVDRAREALADIERQEVEALRAKEYVRQLRSREAEIAESQRELLEARGKVEEAQRSLSANLDENDNIYGPSEVIDKDRERLESAKAALISAVTGTLASIPISLYQATSYPELITHLAVVSISCALFGVTFRYTVRGDLDNFQLKTGACAAFGVIKGLSEVETVKTFELDTQSLISFSIDGALHVSENIFTFLAAAVALDFCFKMAILKPFLLRK